MIWGCKSFTLFIQLHVHAFLLSLKGPYSNSILKWALFNMSGSQWEVMRRPVMPAQQDMLASCLTDISSSLHVDGRLRRASVNLLIPLFWLGPNCGCFRVHLLYIHILYTFIFVLFQHAGNVQQCLLWNSNSLIHWGKKIGVVIKVLPFFNNLSPLRQRSGLFGNIRWTQTAYAVLLSFVQIRV